MDELNQVTGGVTYEYDRFRGEIPDGEEDPHTPSQRETACKSVYLFLLPLFEVPRTSS